MEFFRKYGIIINVFFVPIIFAESIEGNAESCVLSLVVPKESIKNSCNAEYKFTNKILSLESIVRTLQQQVSLLQEKVKITEAPPWTEEIHVMNLEERFKILETKVEQFLNLNQSQNENHIIQTLHSLIKPYIQTELHRIGNDILHNVRKATQGRQSRSRINYRNVPPYQRPHSGQQQHNGGTRTSRRRQYKKENTVGNSDANAGGDNLDELEVESGEGFIPVYNNQRERHSLQEPDLLPTRSENQDLLGDITEDNFESNLWHKIQENMKLLLQNHTVKINRISSSYKSIIESKVKHLIKIIAQMQRSHIIELSAIESTHNSTKVQMNHNIDTIRNELEKTVTRMDVIQEKVLAFAKNPVDIQNLTSEMNAVQRTTSKSLKSLSSKVEAQKHKVTILDRFSNIFQQTLQHYRNESNRFKDEIVHRLNSSDSTMQSEVNSLRKILTQMNSSKINSTDMRLQEVEELVFLIQTSSFDTREEITELRDRVRSDYIQIHRITDKLKDQIGSSLASQLLLNTTMSKISQSFRKIQTQAVMDENNWAEYNFHYVGENNECFGKHYIRKTVGPSSLLVGVILCTSDKYKIVLGESLEGNFLDIGDQHGFGEDHCEFVGADSEYEVEVGNGNMIMDLIDGMIHLHF